VIVPNIVVDRDLRLNDSKGCWCCVFSNVCLLSGEKSGKCCHSDCYDRFHLESLDRHHAKVSLWVWEFPFDSIKARKESRKENKCNGARLR